MATAAASPKTGKVPVWLWAAGGGVLLLLLLGNRNASSGSGSAGGSMQASLADELARQREGFDEKLKLAREEITGDLSDELEARARAEAEAEAEQSRTFAAMLADLRDTFTRALAPNPTPAPSGPAAPLGPRPSDSEIRDWAAGIGLPPEWGFAFVGRWGILPRSIPELETWRSQIGTFNGQQWCIGGICI